MADEPLISLEADEEPGLNLETKWIVFLAGLSGFLYFHSNPSPGHYYDYTFRVAANLLRGSTGLTSQPPSWLNEFVPFGGYYYSVFPLGSVLTMIPPAVLNVAGLITDMPSAWLAGLCAAASCIFMLMIARRYQVSSVRAILMTLGILFGTFTWTNLTMGGAWQLALGFALVGGLGSIYFTVYERRPFLAGIFFALAFGNRTEILLTAPILIYLLVRPKDELADQTGLDGISQTSKTLELSEFASRLKFGWKSIAVFCSVPFVLGVATLIYNFVRFGSLTDFGYARIPGVLDEPWYRYGIFSVWYIPGQMWEMFVKPWEFKAIFPYLRPNGFSSSILLSSPFILYSLRSGSHFRALKYLSWAAILAMCVILWMHGNSGGWQFGYRYAMVCLPWLFLILLESSPKKISPLEWAAYIFSFIANLYATWLFHWTVYMKQ